MTIAVYKLIIWSIVNFFGNIFLFNYRCQKVAAAPNWLIHILKHRYKYKSKFCREFGRLFVLCIGFRTSDTIFNPNLYIYIYPGEVSKWLKVIKKWVSRKHDIFYSSLLIILIFFNIPCCNIRYLHDISIKFLSSELPGCF